MASQANPDSLTVALDLVLSTPGGVRVSLRVSVGVGDRRSNGVGVGVGVRVGVDVDVRTTIGHAAMLDSSRRRVRGGVVVLRRGAVVEVRRGEEGG